MCPNVAFGRAQSHNWFILIDDLINWPSSFSILRAAKSRFTHLVLAQYNFTYIKLGFDIFFFLFYFLFLDSSPGYQSVQIIVNHASLVFPVLSWL